MKVAKFDSKKTHEKWFLPYRPVSGTQGHADGV